MCNILIVYFTRKHKYFMTMALWLCRYCWHNYMMWGSDVNLDPCRIFLLGGGQAQKRPPTKIKKAPQIEKELAKGPHVHGKKSSQ